jgi:hypothetical protein
VERAARFKGTALLLLAWAAPILAQTPVPEELKALLVRVRGHSHEHLETRGATPDFARIKALLREWVESRLTPLARSGEDTLTELQLNTELVKAGIDCDYFPEPPQTKCPDQDLTGFLGDIQLHRSGGFLVVQTAIGIQCGYDESAYIYEWRENRWQRFWENRQSDYTKDKYVPQRLQDVLISPTDYRPDGDKAAHVIVTVGTQPPWCQSNWYPIYCRIWQTRADGPPKLLLDENETGWIDDPINAAVRPDDVLIEYDVAARDGLRRRQIRHYAVGRGTIERIDPVALSPRDFVSSWMDGPSEEAIARSGPGVKGALDFWRRAFESVPAFVEPTYHCKQKPDLWQVGIQDLESERPVGYFLVRWRPPYHFSMAGVSQSPWPDCTEEDPEADEFRTLFPDRDRH